MYEMLSTNIIESEFDFFLVPMYSSSEVVVVVENSVDSLSKFLQGLCQGIRTS